MDIKEFIELSVGIWSSQRTSCDLETKKSENGNSVITIDMLPPSDTEVTELCHQYNIKPDINLGALKSSWDNTDVLNKSWGASQAKVAQKGSSLIVLGAEGQLLQTSTQTGKSIIGSYVLGSDDVLTLTIEKDNISFVERVWFPHNNLRLRTSLIKDSSGLNKTAFYSEIRKLPPKN